ncbi:MAG TPA: sugar phosphate isomerase/epimerase [Vicinamibacterales bacterium]|nr:sugar phosphate isomerase/epimerase [Vicinamibacterales bacterium]
MVTRRQVLQTLCAAAALRPTLDAAASIQYGYAAITWGNDFMTAIDEIAAVGFRGVQLRAGDGLLDRFGDRPAELRELLARKRLSFPVFSSGNLSIDPAREQEMFDLHTKHAKFVHAAGGLYLQVIDERPKGRAVVADDYKRLGRLLTELSKRVRDAGATVVYHPHMNSTGEKPPEVAAVLDAADHRVVRLLFDTAHYQQGGGDPVRAIREYRELIEVLHVKDVRDRPGGSGRPGGSEGYQFVELGRGRVDLKSVFAALNEINFRGWGVVELDRVPDPGRTPRESAEINRRYLVETLHQTL